MVFNERTQWSWLGEIFSFINGAQGNMVVSCESNLDNHGEGPRHKTKEIEKQKKKTYTSHEGTLGLDQWWPSLPPLTHDVCQSKKRKNRALISQCQSLTCMKLWENRMRNKAHAKQGGGIIIFMQIVFFSLMKRDVNKIYNTNTSTGMHGQTSIECSILRRELASRITKGTTSSLPFTNKSNSPKKKCSLTLSFLFLFSHKLQPKVMCFLLTFFQPSGQPSLLSLFTEYLPQKKKFFLSFIHWGSSQFSRSFFFLYPLFQLKKDQPPL